MKLITKSDFKKEVKEFKGVVVADFYADWCGPCRMLSPLLENLDKSNTDKKVKFIKINVDAEQDLAASFGVMSIPTVIFFKDGTLIDQIVGVASKEDYTETIKHIQTHTHENTDTNQEVTIFTTPTCPYCHMAKDYLKEKKVSYKEIDVSKDHAWARKMIQKSGQMGVPQLWIKGQTVVGFNKPQIDMLLRI